MDFYKLTNFQLYSIINSRHLDKKNKQSAVREFDRRGLSDEDIQQLADELTEKQKKGATIFNLSPNVLYLLVIAIAALLLLRLCVYR